MSETQTFWDRQAEQYDRTEAAFEETYNKVLKNTRQHLHHDAVVLDFACGTGTSSIEFAGLVREIHAIDTSSSMIEVAVGKAQAQHIDNVHFSQTSIFDEQFTDGSFDVVLALNILHLLQDPYPVIQRISELLKPGGLFISTTACLREKWSILSTLLPLASRAGLAPYVNRLTMAELEKMIASGGFDIVETEQVGGMIANDYVVAKKR